MLKLFAEMSEITRSTPSIVLLEGYPGENHVPLVPVGIVTELYDFELGADDGTLNALHLKPNRLKSVTGANPIVSELPELFVTPT